MADDGFKGTKLYWGGTTGTYAVGDITDIGFSQDAAQVDVTDADDTTRKTVTGVTDDEVTITVTGVPGTNLNVGQTNNVYITWNDGSTSGNTSTSNAHIVTSRRSSGAVGGAITTALTFKPYGA